MEEQFFIVGIKVLKEKQLPTNRKNSPQILIISKNKFWKVLFKLCKENHRVQLKILDASFSSEFRFETKIGCFFTRLCLFHIAIRPYIFTIYNDIRSIVERTPDSHIQCYFCHKHDSHKRICLSILFLQHYCNSCSFVLVKFFALNFIFIINHIYLLFLCPRKTNTKCCDKIEKTQILLYLNNVVF